MRLPDTDIIQVLPRNRTGTQRSAVSRDASTTHWPVDPRPSTALIVNAADCDGLAQTEPAHGPTKVTAPPLPGTAPAVLEVYAARFRLFQGISALSRHWRRDRIFFTEKAGIQGHVLPQPTAIAGACATHPLLDAVTDSTDVAKCQSPSRFTGSYRAASGRRHLDYMPGLEHARNTTEAAPTSEPHPSRRTTRRHVFLRITVASSLGRSVLRSWSLHSPITAQHDLPIDSQFCC